MSFLEIRHITKTFGGLNALTEVSLDIEKQEIRGLIGPNGAGKSTLFNVVSGFYKPDQGEVIFRGENITGLRPDKVAAKGLVRTFQHNMVFHEMSVLENVILACHLRLKAGFFCNLLQLPPAYDDAAKAKARALELLEFLNLKGVGAEQAKNLPHGHQRLLGVAMALASNPQILLLDEPLAGMSAADIQVMAKHIREIRKKRGVAIILVEHNVGIVTELCDNITVLNYGQRIAEGPAGDIVNNSEVIKAYFGTKETGVIDAGD